MLIRLLRAYLAPYRRPIAGLLVLSLAGTMAALLLPSLNAAIIDEGVAKGDTGYIWRTGADDAGRHVGTGRLLDLGYLSGREDGDELRP